MPTATAQGYGHSPCIGKQLTANCNHIFATRGFMATTFKLTNSDFVSALLMCWTYLMNFIHVSTLMPHSAHVTRSRNSLTGQHTKKGAKVLHSHPIRFFCRAHSDNSGTYQVAVCIGLIKYVHYMHYIKMSVAMKPKQVIASRKPKIIHLKLDCKSPIPCPKTP